MSERPVKAEEQSRLVSTEIDYRKVASARFQEHRDSEYANTVEGMVMWAQRKADSVRSSTWRYYRAAMVYALNKDAAAREDQNAPEAQDLIQLANKLRVITSANEKTVDRTSSKKRKSLPPKMLNEILVELEARRSKYSELLALFMWINPITGLRPIEWSTASLTEEEKTGRKGIRILNAKATNGRSNGKYRTLWFDDSAEQRVIDGIETLLSNLDQLDAHNNEAGWKKVYESLRKLLNRVTGKLYPRHKKKISMYSTRHQFNADLKASDYTAEEAAALNGHISKITARTHYGKRRVGGSHRKEVNRIHVDESNMTAVLDHSKTIKDKKHPEDKRG